MTRSLDNSQTMKLCPVEEQSQNRFDLRLLAGTKHATGWPVLQSSAHLLSLLCCLYPAPHFESCWASLTAAKTFTKTKLYNFAILCGVTKPLSPFVPRPGSCLYTSNGFTSVASEYGCDTAEIWLFSFHVISPHHLEYWLTIAGRMIKDKSVLCKYQNFKILFCFLLGKENWFWFWKFMKSLSPGE